MDEAARNMGEGDFWDLVFLGAIFGGASAIGAEKTADRALEIRRARNEKTEL